MNGHCLLLVIVCLISFFTDLSAAAAAGHLWTSARTRHFCFWTSSLSNGQTQYMFLQQHVVGRERSFVLFDSIWNKQNNPVDCITSNSHAVINSFSSKCRKARDGPFSEIPDGRFNISMLVEPGGPCVPVGQVPELGAHARRTRDLETIEYETFHQKSEVSSQKLKRSKRAWLIPGTLWCGSGNKATNFSDLGLFEETDKCCREHDHCEQTIASFEFGYGVFNTNFFTLSHCGCDSKFRQCLHDANDRVSDMVGYGYFNVLKMRCFEFSQRMECAQWTWWGMCKYSQMTTYALVKDARDYNSTSLAVEDDQLDLSINHRISFGDLTLTNDLVIASEDGSKRQRLAVTVTKAQQHALFGITEESLKGHTTDSSRKETTETTDSSETTDTSKMKTTDSSEIKTAYLSNTETTDSSETETTDTSKMKTTDSSKIKTTDSSKIKTAYPSNTETTDSSKTETTDSSKTETTDSSKTKTTESAETETTDPSKMKTTESAETVTSKSPKTDTTDSHKAETTESTNSKSKVSPHIQSTGTSQRQIDSPKTKDTNSLDKKATDSTDTQKLDVTRKQTTTNSAKTDTTDSPSLYLHSEIHTTQKGQLDTCESYKDLDSCRYQIPPLQEKFGLRNAEHTTLYHCNCTARLARELADEDEVHKVHFWLLDFVSQSCFILHQNCTGNESCSASSNNDAIHVERWSKDAAVWRHLAAPRRKAKRFNSKRSKRKDSPIRLHKKCLRMHLKLHKPKHT